MKKLTEAIRKQGIDKLKDRADKLSLPDNHHEHLNIAHDINTLEEAIWVLKNMER